MDPKFLRAYYTPALNPTRRSSGEIYWSGEEPETPDNTSNWLKFGGATAAAFGAGSISIGKKRIWDYYVGGARAFEEYFIGNFPRTLQLSNIFSQFETASLNKRIISPEQLQQWGGKHLDYLSRLTGVASHELGSSGVRFEGNKLFLGNSEKVILENASVIRNLNKSPHFLTSYARSLGMPIGSTEKFFEEALPFTNAAGESSQEIFQFIGGQSRLQSAKRQAFGIGTELVQRVNRLANADIPVFGSILQKVMPFKLGVEPGPGLKTLAKLTGKLGILGGLAVGAYSYADYAVRNIDLFNYTTFDKGLTAGFANIWANTNLAYAKFGDVTGWTESAKRQEEYAPGSTSLQHLAAFPAVGAMTAGFAYYGQRLLLTGRLQARGRDLATASKRAQEILSRPRGTGPVTQLTRFLRESKWGIARAIGKSKLATMTAMGTAIGIIPTLPFLFNALAPGESEAELQDIYSGRQEVAIRKGRYWEFGRSPFEGGNIQYYRPHWYARMMQDSKDESIWGPLEEQAGRELSPLERWYTKNFTYELESAHYRDRPFPVTGRPLYDVPIIGPVLSATIGQIFKPTVYMHQEEYMNAQGEYAQLPPGFGESYSTEIGGQLPGTPISSHGLRGTIGEQAYRLGELVGLPGFMAMSIKEAITGSQTPFEDIPQLQSADEMYGASRDFYDLNLGGMLGSNELFRRLVPRKRTQLEQYNVIRNTMPEWLPGPSERGPNLLYGDPYSQIPEGELRLPGEGYAARYPELEGVSPEDYPLIHKYKILADVGTFTEKFDYVAAQVRGLHNAKQLTEEEEAIYAQTEAQLDAKRQKRTFYDYKYRDREVNSITQTLTDWNNEQKEASSNSWYESTMGSFWETVAHNIETPIEQLTPLSPAAKLLHMRTAIEDYKQTQVYGTESAFWNRPIENFIRPFTTTAASAFGYENIPENIQGKRNLEEYFDILKYIKFTRLKEVAEEAWDSDAASQFEEKRRETLFGVNPFGFNYAHIFRSLPRRDRDYFNEFSEEEDINRRSEILNLIPDNERALYMAKWEQLDNTQFQKAQKAGILSDEQVAIGQAKLQSMYEEMSSEGLPKDRELWQEYIATRARGESYADWYRRTKLIEQKVSELGVNIPGPDWVGWHPSVDLDDIKLKMVQNEGESIQDYDLWPDRAKGLLYKQRFINDETIEPLQESYDLGSVRANIHALLESEQISNPQIEVTMVPGDTNKVDLDISEDRTEEIKSKLRRFA